MVAIKLKLFFYKLGNNVSKLLLRKDFFEDKVYKYQQRLANISVSIRDYKKLIPEEKTALKVLEKAGKHSFAREGLQATNTDTKIGSFCSIALNVILGPGKHPTHFLSSHPSFYLEECKLTNETKTEHFELLYPVEIGNDVWIGHSVIVQDGIKVGDGAVIGSGAIVTKDVPPYAIVAGVPAKILRYRFDEDTIKDLLELKWWELDDDLIATLPFSDIPSCIKMLKEIRSTEGVRECI